MRKQSYSYKAVLFVLMTAILWTQGCTRPVTVTEQPNKYDEVAGQVLNDLARAQDDYRAGHQAYAGSVKELVQNGRIAVPEGIVLKITLAAKDKWHATAWHPNGTRVWIYKSDKGGLQE